jgi:hypothetical protein
MGGVLETGLPSMNGGNNRIVQQFGMPRGEATVDIPILTLNDLECVSRLPLSCQYQHAWLLFRITT